jgi:hypothetical protein
MRLRLLVSAAAMLAMTSTAVAATREKSAKPANDPDKVICKRFVETGSLVKGTRTCKTRREWDREHENIRASIQGGGSCASGESGACN